MSSPFLVFDFAEERGKPQRIRFESPEEIIVASTPGEVVPALERIQTAVQNGAFAAGLLSYEAAPAFDPAFHTARASSFPLLWFGLFSAPCAAPFPAHRQEYSLEPWRSDTDVELFARRIAMIREAIGRGETYQVNYTVRLLSCLTGDAFSYYEHLRDRQKADYCAYLDIGDYRILSASPELFFRRSGNRITTRPMKGTAERGRWGDEDRRRAELLRASVKDRAENIMIVDMLRNDLGRIAEIGSVEVTSLFNLERYPTVWQMTSGIECVLNPNTEMKDLFRALFPCGSVTGAPKVSTMHLISELEAGPRNVYCGAIGFMTPAQTAVFSVPIRTVIQETSTGKAEYGVGSGITWDSTAELEYAEVAAKAVVLAETWPAFELLETIRLEAGEFVLLPRHLARLADSSDYFSYPFDLSTINAALEEARLEAGAGAWRVRLLLSPDGAVTVEKRALNPWPEGRAPCALSSRPIDSADVFLYHKTTNRICYEQQRDLYPHVYDTLMINERGELTEFTLGNVVIQLPGENGPERWTPPRECGLLAGTMRAELLERGAIREKVLTPTDLKEALAVWLVNSVRGWVPIEISW